MTIHRFFIDPEYIKVKTVNFPEETAHQIAQVLRLRSGDKVVVLDNSLNEYEVILEESHKKSVWGRIVAYNVNQNEPRVKVKLYQALIPKDKFELLLQKVTEIGVTNIIPVETQRSVINTNMISEDRLERWNRIVKEAAEQCERGVFPQIESPIRFKEAVERASQEGKVFLAFERQTGALKIDTNNNTETVSLFIGPEGGFTDEEVEFAKAKGAEIISLGSRILRAETAAIVGSALIIQHIE